MKKTIAIIIAIILIVIPFSGCQKNETVVPRGWFDDTEALSIKINRMNKYEVRNLLGEPVAKILGEESDVFLDENGVALFVFYDEDEVVKELQKEKTEVVISDVNAQKRCEIMNKLIGRTKEEICSRYGEFDSISKDQLVGKYKDFDGVKVSVYFNEDDVAEKLAIMAKKKSENASDEENSSEETETTLDPLVMLDNVAQLREKIIGMDMRAFLDIFGDPSGTMEEQNCRVYFDSDRNCVFVYFNTSRQVAEAEVIKYSEVKQKEYYSLTDKELLTLLMYEFIGKSESEILEYEEEVEVSFNNPHSYGFINMYGKKVYFEYDKQNILKTVAIKNMFYTEELNGNIEYLREWVIGLTRNNVQGLFGRYDGSHIDEKCYGYLNDIGYAILFYYNKDNVIYKIEEIYCDEVRINGAKTTSEKFALFLSDFVGKTETEIEVKYGIPDAGSDIPKIYTDIDGQTIRAYYGNDGKVIQIYVE